MEQPRPYLWSRPFSLQGDSSAVFSPLLSRAVTPPRFPRLVQLQPSLGSREAEWGALPVGFLPACLAQRPGA